MGTTLMVLASDPGEIRTWMEEHISQADIPKWPACNVNAIAGPDWVMILNDERMNRLEWRVTFANTVPDDIITQFKLVWSYQ
jgi:hypothetical protein